MNMLCSGTAVISKGLSVPSQLTNVKGGQINQRTFASHYADLDNFERIAVGNEKPNSEKIAY
jgi:cytidylate kinase